MHNVCVFEQLIWETSDKKLENSQKALKTLAQYTYVKLLFEGGFMQFVTA